MKTALIVAVLAAVLAPPAHAIDELSEGFSSAQGMVPRVSLRAVDACFERDADPRADALMLPKRFCLKTVGTSVTDRDRSPFAHDANGLVDEGQGLRPVHVSGGMRTTRGWTINVDLFKYDSPTPACGRLNYSFAAAYFDVDLEGKPLDGPVEVRGFMIDASGQCLGKAKSIKHLYRRL